MKSTSVRLAAFAVASGFGLWAGATSGLSGTAQAAERPARITGAHGESPFYVSLAPSSSSSDGDGDSLALVTAVGNRQGQAMRGVVSVTIEDDRGRIVRDTEVSPVVTVGAKQEAQASTLSTPRLADGFYRIRAQAVFAEGKQVRGSETDSLYLEVVKGSVAIIDMSDWHQRSRVNEVHTP